ncbi:ABC-2 type transport system ATP-binding protein [Parafrankia irregularis]|uniref:ABC-2 type transport system ATP-binding protein n=1 Tax=Parafrankia irregularis TaxID=795642 RepID=A0A0S4QR02_9ACTN|nr:MULTISPECIES: ATP-binding cassette domain-containing protein [Parafrankia]MBE3205883.1 ATP-binding cassette domain-containing protein [Parafrankia sp. CH37]CUU58171.1 ABC-2 type transport system ATP-binding protein [Parafrankia irregularis]
MINVNGLRKRFGAVTALDGMTFTVPAGQVTGFVGPNGAGKSTTMRVILGLDTADSGEALIGGRPYRELRNPLRHVGALLDASAVGPSRTARNHLLWLAHSQGLGARRVDEVLQEAGLTSVARRRVGGFSLGMRQRLGIAAALIGDPPALMLDEPFNGMDPEGIIWMRRFTRALADAGRAVLVSSHLMNELEDIADRVVVVGRGKVFADAGVAELLAAVSDGRVTVRTTAGGPAAAVLEAAVLAAGGGSVTPAGPDALVVAGLSAEEIAGLLGRHDVPFSELTAHRATLEDAYLNLTRDAVEYRATVAGEGR